MVDMDKVEQMARKAATTKLNATKIQAYWDAVNKVVDAMTELRESLRIETVYPILSTKNLFLSSKGDRKDII